jgi:hypothetical protein
MSAISERIREAALHGQRAADNTVYGLRHVEAMVAMAFLGFDDGAMWDWLEGDHEVKERTFILLVAEAIE